MSYTILQFTEMSNIKCYHIVKLTQILNKIKASRISLLGKRESKKAYPHQAKSILVFFSCRDMDSNKESRDTPPTNMIAMGVMLPPSR